MTSPTIWLVGDWTEPIFADAIAWLQASADCCGFDLPPLAAQHRVTAQNDVDPTAIVVAVSRPGRFAASDIERLHALLPLARLVVLTEPWCEGEQRSGRPWAGIVRVPWHSWRQRLPREIGFNTATETRQPRTATETERAESSAAAIRSTPPSRGSAAIRTHSLANYRYLADAAGQLGLAVAPRSDDGATADVVIFDGWENVLPPSELGQPSNDHPPQRRILTLHFPRPDDYVHARAAKLDGILGQPLVLTDLMAALSRTQTQAS